MIAPSVASQLCQQVGDEFWDPDFVSGLWASLDVPEKLQLLTDLQEQNGALGSHFAEHATHDPDPVVRYWAIRRAGYQRRASVRLETMQRLQSDPSSLVSRRAIVWSYGDVAVAGYSVAAAYLSGANWTETPEVQQLVEDLATKPEPDWPRIEHILKCFLAAPAVDAEYRSRGPHNAFLVMRVGPSLERLKLLMLRYPEQLGHVLGVGLPVRFHSFDLLEGWETFPKKVLAEIAAYRRTTEPFRSVVLRTLEERRPDDAALQGLYDHLRMTDQSHEWELNRGACASDGAC